MTGEEWESWRAKCVESAAKLDDAVWDLNVALPSWAHDAVGGTVGTLTALLPPRVQEAGEAMLMMFISRAYQIGYRDGRESQKLAPGSN